MKIGKNKFFSRCQENFLWLQKWNKTHLAALLGYETIILHHQSWNPEFSYVLMPPHCEILLCNIGSGLPCFAKQIVFMILFRDYLCGSKVFWFQMPIISPFVPAKVETIAQLLSSFDGSFWQNRSFKNSISFSSKFLTKKRIRRLVPSVLR